jgi:hypothetical protein
MIYKPHVAQVKINRSIFVHININNSLNLLINGKYN